MQLYYPLVGMCQHPLSTYLLTLNTQSRRDVIDCHLLPFLSPPLTITPTSSPPWGLNQWTLKFKSQFCNITELLL